MRASFRDKAMRSSRLYHFSLSENVVNFLQSYECPTTRSMLGPRRMRTIFATLIWVVTGETISIRFKSETVVTTQRPSFLSGFPGKCRGRTLRCGYIHSSLPGKCSPWSQDRLHYSGVWKITSGRKRNPYKIIRIYMFFSIQLIFFALLFSPSYVVVTQSITGTTILFILMIYVYHHKLNTRYT